MTLPIYSDTRDIREIVLANGKRIFTAGYNNIQIIPYQETGEMAYVTWFAIYDGDDIVMRVNVSHVAHIEYAGYYPYVSWHDDSLGSNRR